MARGPDRRRLPLILFALAALGGLALFLLPRCEDSPTVDDLVDRTRIRMQDGVHELVVETGGMPRLLPDLWKDELLATAPDVELTVAQGGRFHYRVSVLEEPAFHIGFDGKKAWTWNSRDATLRLIDENDLALSGHGYLERALVRRVMRGWRNLQQILTPGGSEDPNNRFELEDRVLSPDGEEKLLWRLATTRSRGDERLRLWVDQEGRVERLEIGVLAFRVRERKDLDLEHFEIKRWTGVDVSGDGDEDAPTKKPR